MSAYTCPKGHLSADADFCDTCGAKIAGPGPLSTPSSAPSAQTPLSAPVAAPAQPPPREICPHCGMQRTGSLRFCEDCGYDHTTGKMPQVDEAPAPARAAGRWTATIFADRAYFAANAIEGVDFPENAPDRTVVLPPPQIRIGRRSASKGTSPELDLAQPPSDPGVSHNHALLTLSIDGVWLVSDLGSTNGTYLNDEDEPLTAGQTRTLKDGDQVHVGAWTTIVLHAPSP